MLNQKGIAFIPILIWAVAILFTGTAAVKSGLITVDLNHVVPPIQKVDTIPTTPSPASTSTPEPTFIPKQKEVYLPKPTIIPSPSPIPTITPQPKAQTFDWSTYRAARIEGLKSTLKKINENIAFFEKEKAKYAQYSDNAVALYQSGQRTVEEFNKVVESLDELDAVVESNLQETYRDIDKNTALLRRFEAGENVPPAEEKAILGY